MSTKNTAQGATAAPTVDHITEHRTFGNLAKLVPLAILSAGMAVGLVVTVAQGGDYEALLNGALTFASFAGAGVVGSVTAWRGRSQTQLDLLAVREALTEPVPGTTIRADRPDSEALHGQWNNNLPQDAAGADAGPAPVVTAPALYKAAPAPVDPTINPAE